MKRVPSTDEMILSSHSYNKIFPDSDTWYFFFFIAILIELLHMLFSQILWLKLINWMKEI